MSEPPERLRNLKWPTLQLPAMELSTLDVPFSEEEILKAINQLPLDKAPGPNGYTGLFFKKCWPIVGNDIIATINSFYNLRCNNLNILNYANIVLIPKKTVQIVYMTFGPSTSYTHS